MVFKQKIYKTKEGDRQTHRQTKVPEKALLIYALPRRPQNVKAFLFCSIFQNLTKKHESGRSYN